MKNEELKRLEKDLSENKELQTKWETALKASTDGAKSDNEVISQAAKSLGYTISVSELEKAQAQEQKLSNEDLELATGGVTQEDEYGHDGSCTVTWHCWTAFLHTEDESHNTRCWSDYGCAFAYEHE